ALVPFLAPVVLGQERLCQVLVGDEQALAVAARVSESAAQVAPVDGLRALGDAAEPLDEGVDRRIRRLPGLGLEGEGGELLDEVLATEPRSLERREHRLLQGDAREGLRQRER